MRAKLSTYSQMGIKLEGKYEKVKVDLVSWRVNNNAVGNGHIIRNTL